MVGKIRRMRPKLHQEAVKLDIPSRVNALQCFVLSPRERATHSLLPSLPDSNRKNEQPLAESPFPSGIFVGTKITPNTLVQTLKLGENPETPVLGKKESEKRRVKSKKDKMKDRQERWLYKIRSIKQAQEQQAAMVRRQATPIIGDMKPLANALPDLCKLIGSPTASANVTTTRRKSRKDKMPMKRPEPTDFSQMKTSQKRKLLEMEHSHFCNAVKTLSGKVNVLADISEQLRKRMRQEEERSPS